MAAKTTTQIVQEKLGRILITEKMLTEEQLAGALSEQAKEKSPRDLGTILIEQGYVSEKNLTHALGIQFNLAVLETSQIAINPEIIKLVPEEIIKRHLVLPVFLVERELTLAVSDPTQLDVIDAVSTETKCHVQTVLATRTDLQSAITGYFMKSQRRQSSTVSLQQFDPDRGGEAEIERLKRAGKELPVIELVDEMISQAADKHASDIHIEPGERRSVVRYRVEGALSEVAAFPTSLYQAIVSRIKVLAQLDTAERQKPQEGRIQFELGTRALDIRVSSVPAYHGETIALRVFDRGRVRLGLEELGFSKPNFERLESLIHQPSGIILVTGPAGSGKSTTLYAILNAIKSVEKKILTIEDPIEYPLPLVNQIQVNPKKDFGFENAFRAALRQDPDVIMVGEIPGPDTGTLMTEAALTGHLVLGSLNTGDAKSGIMRLVEMGVEPYLLAPSLLGVIAHRLVRTICPQCKSSYEPKKSELGHLNLTDLPPGMTVCRGTGCAACQQLGYKGRTGVHEVLVVDDEMRELISERASAGVIAGHAKKKGFTDLRYDGIRKVLDRQTTVEELLRVAKGF
ncbi:MAG TPA: GspE/PulE family protein [Nitrospiria bacterium]|nr:GspE/PulE family protein [Nitrospiria bacterium]